MIYLSLGSNHGNRLNNLRKAFELLSTLLSDIKHSIVIETKAIVPSGHSPDSQNTYLNMVVCAKTKLSPADLLSSVKEIERKLGRAEVYDKWSSRVIDIDILLYDEKIIESETLSVPHKELLNRPFFSHLIATLDPYLKHPQLQKTFSDIASLDSIRVSSYIRSFALFPKLVGVVNVTPDSFSDGGMFYDHKAAANEALKLNIDGAHIIELGAQSTRPGALINPENELPRLEPVLDLLSSYVNAGDLKISVDTFWPDIIYSLLSKYKISWINDVKGSLDNKTLSFIAESGAKIVAMHSLIVPPRKDICIDTETNIIEYLNDWAGRTCDRLTKCGFVEKNIILDPGIGFGKNSYQNIYLLRNVHRLKRFGCEILIGHSRKSYINCWRHSEPYDRDLETIAVSNSLQSKNVDYLRVHNVADHHRFFVASEII